MITIIGDSHVSGFALDDAILEINNFTIKDYFNVLHLGPKTVYAFDKIIDTVIIKLQNNKEFNESKALILSLGEIDIRSHMFNKNSSKFINLQFISKLKCIITELESLGKPVILYGYVAPLNDEKLFPQDLCNVHGSHENRNLMRHDVMNLLRRFDIKYFDIYKFTTNEYGFLDFSKTFDGLHLNSETMNIIKEKIKAVI